jgi:SNF2 family DNA or RNA helicase
MRGYKFDGLILDECHYLKNPEAMRTRVFLSKNGPFDRAESIFALSGTPIVNRPLEIFSVLNRMCPKVIPTPTLDDFGRMFCEVEYNRFAKKWVYTGAKNKEVLGRVLRSNCMVRRLKADVLEQLPPKIRRVIHLDATAEIEKALKREHALYSKDENFGLTPEEVREAFAVRVQLALWKVNDAEKYIRDILETEAKVIVFGWHREPLARLTARLAEFRPLIVTGKTPVDERQKRVDAFQNEDRHRLFFGSIAAAGVGVTLTRSHHVVMLEASWKPGENEQAEDRAHRITQLGTVVVDYLTYQNSVDERVLSVANRKSNVISKILNA